ncbi:MAG: isocitrate lyase/PEP mutase family protein [Candidatus Hydrogenedentota bacterium]
MALTLKELLEKDELVQAPGAYDGLTSRLIEEAGFSAVYMTGYGTAATYGLPDEGLIGREEMLHNATRIARAVNIPVIADADTGYGDPVEVARTVATYETAGVQAIQLEDQTWPKRCGHMEGKTLVSTNEMVEKLRAACEARSNEDTLIVARTDAIAVEGFDAALERASAYAKAGADILFVEAPEDREQLQEIPEALPQRPHLVNLAPRTPSCSADELQAMGYSLAIFPGLCLMAQVEASRAALQTLRETGIQDNLLQWTEEFEAINAFLRSGALARKMINETD